MKGNIMEVILAVIKALIAIIGCFFLPGLAFVLTFKGLLAKATFLHKFDIWMGKQQCRCFDPRMETDEAFRRSICRAEILQRDRILKQEREIPMHAKRGTFPLKIGLALWLVVITCWFLTWNFSLLRGL